MKTFLVVVLFFTALATHVNGQGVPDGGGGVPDTDVPDVDGIPEENMPDADVAVDAEGAIDIEGLKCLCDIQVSANTDGEVDASASGGGDCGLGDPAPTLSIDCDAVRSGKVNGAYFYILEVSRSSIRPGYGSFVTFDKQGYETMALNFPKGLSEDNDLTIFKGGLSPENDLKDKVHNLEDKELSLCNNDQSPGSWEHTLLEMANQLILDGKGCPVEEGAKTAEASAYPNKLPAAIYQFPEMLPCIPMSWDVSLNDPEGKFAFQIYMDFTPKGLCKPVPPKDYY